MFFSSRRFNIFRGAQVNESTCHAFLQGERQAFIFVGEKKARKVTREFFLPAQKIIQLLSTPRYSVSTLFYPFRSSLPPFLLRSVNGLTRASSVRSMVFAFERRHVGRKRMKFHLIRKGKHSPRTYSLAIVISPISRLSRGSTVKPGLLIPRAFCLQNTCASLHPTCPIQTRISSL